MDWLTIAISIAVFWIASFCKIFCSSFLQSKAAYFPGGDQKKNVLLVIAHPDDESMFFAPSINYLTSRGHNVCILCLSTGNADGMGKIRSDELYKASVMLKVPVQKVKVVDHPDLQDGFGKEWNLSLIAKLVDEQVTSHSIDLVLTFDSYGVSGHCNHRDVHAGVSVCIGCISISERRNQTLLLGDYNPTATSYVKLWDFYDFFLLAVMCFFVSLCLSCFYALQ